MKLSNSIHDTLQIALNTRMEECRKGLTQIILSGNFETHMENDEVARVASATLKKHFSVLAYKAMMSAKDKLSETNNLTVDTFSPSELTQLLKAVGALKGGYSNLINWLVDTLIFNMTRRQD